MTSIAAVAFAAWLMGYPVYTNFVQGRIQDRLGHELASGELRTSYACTAAAQEGCDRLQEGDSVTRLVIPRLDLDVVVVEGVSPGALRAGAGHFPQTALPCAVGNAAIAGHRTTYGRPFSHLDALRPGDELRLETPIGRCTYQVAANPIVVAPESTWVLSQGPDPTTGVLTLTTCHPKGSAKQRLVVFGALSQTEVAAS